MYMVFDIKKEDFRGTTGLLAGDHLTKSPDTIMYVSIVSSETVRIALMIANL